MYSINGVALNDPRFGWIYRRGSHPFVTLSAAVAEAKPLGRWGVVQEQTGMTASLWSCIINTPYEHRETLNALFTQQALELAHLAKPGRVATAQFMASEVDTFYHADQSVDMRYTLMLLDAAWRDKAVSTSPVVLLNQATVQVGAIFPGSSAPVQDAVIRCKGGFSGLQITDKGSGAWLTFGPEVPGSAWFRFEAATGRAFTTLADTWTGGVEVSGDVSFGGIGELFEIAPTWTTDPSVRAGTLTVATSARSGGSMQVRGRGAYIE